jgi:signal transduction histidine kinase
MTLAYIKTSSRRTTLLVVRGTFIATAFIGTLLWLYTSIVRPILPEWGLVLIALSFIYLLLAEFLMHKNYRQIVNYMLILFYIFVSFYSLLSWGLNAPIGLLTISFALTLPSLLMGVRSIMPVLVLSIIVLISVQLFHSDNIVKPSTKHLSFESTFWDVALYSTILSIFASVSWLAGSQREKGLQRAIDAEAALRSQKAVLATELAKESSALRLAQLNQIRQLHKFALLGQSTAATLHELSNHLSILNLDIDDLHQQNSNSQAIKNAKEGIEHLNDTVRQARQQLNTYDENISFNAVTIINRGVKDLASKYKYYGVKLTRRSTGKRSASNITGSPLALMQIITILLNNALDAVKDRQHPSVTLETHASESKLIISVIDNGAGVNPTIKSALFKPITSTKSSGLGVGLYIAHHLTEDQFNGSIKLISSEHGAHFMVVIPRGSETESSHTHPQSHALHSTASH